MTTLDDVAKKKAEPSAEQQAAVELVRLAQEQGLSLTGPDGLLKQLTKTVLETALNEEMTEHLGYEKHDPPEAGTGNIRNGTRSKTVLTDTTGPVELDVPRDRAATFEPQIVKKRQRRLSGVNEVVLSLYAKGLTTGEISAHSAEIYGASGEHHRKKWQMALEMIDELISWGRTPAPVVADAGYGESTALRLALTDRDIPYVVAVRATVSAHPGHATPVQPPRTGARGRPPAPAYPDPPVGLKELALAAGADGARTITWREGTKASPTNPAAAMSSQFLILRIRPANRDIPRAPDGSLPECWLIAHWPSGVTEPIDYWLSSLPADTPAAELVRLAKMRWRIEHDYRELKTGLGLDHFEGRSWLGWHHHSTLVTAAHLFLTTLRLTAPKANGQD